MSELRTTPVRVLSNLGLVHDSDPYRFVEPMLVRGETAELIVEGELPFEVPEGWVLLRCGPFYAPVHPSMIEPLTDEG